MKFLSMATSSTNLLSQSIFFFKFRWLGIFFIQLIDLETFSTNSFSQAIVSSYSLFQQSISLLLQIIFALTFSMVFLFSKIISYSFSLISHSFWMRYSFVLQVMCFSYVSLIPSKACIFQFWEYVNDSWILLKIFWLKISLLLEISFRLYFHLLQFVDSF